jgi:ribosome recycling factor
MRSDNPQELIKDGNHRMEMAVEATTRDFSAIRTGRANPQLLNKIHVDYYGAETPLNQVADISVPEPRQLLIKPYDKNLIQQIEKAILKSDLGLNPSTDSNGIRLIFPQMTEDRRKEMVKQVHHRSEEGCIAVRNVRRDVLEHLKKLQKDKIISEDELKRYETEVQKLTDKYVNEIHDLQKKKDAELMEV